MKVDILAIAAHPDDIELSCVGTLLKHIDEGKSVGLLDLTQGELGTRGTPELRAQEAEVARQMMGAAFRKNIQLPDGFFQYKQENIVKIIEVIRWCQPTIVLANAPRDRHPDHGRASKLIADACFYAGLVKIETKDENGQLQDRWRPDAVYHYIQDYNLEADFVVDISDYMERKIELVQAFQSQFYDPDSGELTTPLTGADFFEMLRGKAKVYGRPAGFSYAEGFINSRTPGVKSLFDLV